MRKKFLILVIGLVLIFAVVAISAAEDYPEYQEAIAHIMEQDYDLEGEEITIAGWPGISAWEDEPELKQRKESVEEEFNCKINFIQKRSIEVRDELPAGVMSGDPEADIYVTWDWVYFEHLLPAEVLYPVGEILGDKYYENLPPVFSIVKDVGEYKGNRYAFSSGIDTSGRAMFWNKEIFEEEGLPNVYELIENDEWTYDKLKEIAIKATRDTNGDGETDQWGLGGLTKDGDVSHFWCSNNADFVTFDEEGKGEFGLIKPQALEVLEYVHELVNIEEVVYEKDKDEFVRGNIAVHFEHYKNAGHFMNEMDPDNWGLAHLPQGPNTTEYHNIAETTWPAMLPITVDNPEALLAIYHSLYPLEKLAVEFEENWLDKLPTVESYEIWKEIQNSWVTYRTYGLRNIVFPKIRSILAGDITPSTAMEEIKDEAQAQIDDYLGQ